MRLSCQPAYQVPPGPTHESVPRPDDNPWVTIGRKTRLVSEVSPKELVNEKDTLTVALTRILGLMMEIPWADWQPICDQIGARLDAVKHEIAKRSVRS